MKIPKFLVHLSILSFSLFAIGTTSVCQDAGNVPEGDSTEELNFARAPLLFLDSYSNQNYRLMVQNSITLSENYRLFRFLMNEEVCKELELTNEQKQSLSNLKKIHLEIYQELQTKLDQLDEFEANESDESALIAVRSKVRTWVVNSSKKFAKRWEELLLPHQLELLKKVRVNYLVAIFGHANVLKSCVDEGLLNVDPKSIELLKVAQKRLSPELMKRCKAFAKEEIELVTEVIKDEERATNTIAILKKANLSAIPELIVAQAGELENKNLKSRTSLQSIWADRITWELSTDGTFEGKLHRNEALAADYIVNAFHKDKALQSDLEISKSQIEKFGEILEEIGELNSEVAELLEDCKPNSSKYQAYIKDWTGKKERLVESRVDEVFVHFQKAAIDEWNQLVELRRFGIYFSLLSGQMGKTIKVTSSEKKKVRKLAEKAATRYEKFAKKTEKWYFDELLASLKSEEDRKQIAKLFNHDFQILKLPVGCLSLTLIQNGTTK